MRPFYANIHCVSFPGRIQPLAANQQPKSNMALLVHSSLVPLRCGTWYIYTDDGRFHIQTQHHEDFKGEPLKEFFDWNRCHIENILHTTAKPPGACARAWVSTILRRLEMNELVWTA